MDSMISTEFQPYNALGIRCPIHRYIVFESNMMRHLINTPAFQRLRGITQLGTCSKVFPSANHTRFEHCLGVAHLCLQYAKKFNSRSESLLKLLPTKCVGTLEDLMSAAGLLHDIAHGPFSHDWDRAVYSKLYPGVDKGHDEVRKFIVLNDHEIRFALSLANLTPENIVDAWQTKPISQMISGPLSADQMDYVCRDSKMLGTEHFGGVDPIRMINNALITSGNELKFRKTCANDVKIFQNTRELAYSNVYLHSQVSQYADLIKKMMFHLIEAEPTILTVEMCSVAHFVKWTETYFFYRYLRVFGETSVLYQQWVNRELHLK